MFARLGVLFSLCILLMQVPAQAEEVVNIYSSQQEHLIRPILDVFEKETGITVNLTTGGDGTIITKLEQEGEHSPADVLMATDIGNIYLAKSKGLLQGITSDVLTSRIPEHLRSPEGEWFGLTVRARALFYKDGAISPDELSTYEDLASEKWKDAVLVRSSTNIYNQSLLASIIAHDGKEEAQAWAKGIAANLARTPQGGDRDQLKALAVGEGKVAMANTYYFGLLLNSEDPKERELASTLKIFFPNQDGRGTHVNIRGAGVTAHAKHKENAIKLLEFLAGDEAQAFFSEHNYEYPAVPSAKQSDTIAAWGTFKQDTLPLETVGKLNAEAVKLFDMANWP